MASYPERSSTGRDQWLIERGSRPLRDGPTRMSALLLIPLCKPCGWGARMQIPQVDAYKLTHVPPKLGDARLLCFYLARFGVPPHATLPIWDTLG